VIHANESYEERKEEDGKKEKENGRRRRAQRMKKEDRTASPLSAPSSIVRTLKPSS
jgi:hypothetical protein